MTVKNIAEAYLEAWSQKDGAAIAALISSAITFKGPMAQTEGADAFMSAVGAMFPLLQRIDRRALFVNGDAALAIYDFVCVEPIGLCRTAELIGVKDEKIEFERALL